MANDNQISAFFSHLVSSLGREKDVYIVAVAHMVSNTLHFAPALDDFANLTAILAKPKSKGSSEYPIISSRFRVLSLSREWATDASKVVAELTSLGLGSKRIVLVDIGGYFSESIDDISRLFDGEVIGVLEGTENGARRYDSFAPHTTPTITVARSPLKLPEDYLIGSSVVFSIEAVLRGQSEILQTRTAAVIGYGRVGSAIADILKNRGLNTAVYDTDWIKLAEAAARGYRACKRLEIALSSATLVVCATGNISLDLKGFAMLNSGTVVASVTSADDEFDLAGLSGGYLMTTNESGDIVRYSELGRENPRWFDMIAGGNAANFLHGAVVGPAIQLIEGEKLAAIKALISGGCVADGKRIAEVSADGRREVAEIWSSHFLA